MVTPIGLRYVLCPGSMPKAGYDETYREIYQCWRETWENAFAELKIDKPFYSDSFTRQDYIGAIFLREKCIALSFFKWTDASRPEFSLDSYFSNWTPEHQKVLRSRGDRIIVCCQFTVHPSARGQTIGLSAKDLLVGMVTETFLNSDADAMTGAVRVDRGVNRAGERWGAYVIDRKVPCDYGEKNTDLIGFFKDHMRKQPRHELKPLAENLWKNRIIIPRQELSLQFSHFDQSATDSGFKLAGGQ